MRPLFRTTLPSLSARLALFVLPLISSAGTAADGAARILSVYHGLEEVTARAMRWCNRSAVEPQDGMPLVFSVQIDADSVSPSAFAVEEKQNSEFETSLPFQTVQNWLGVRCVYQKAERKL